jgi:hypothetical protein
LRLLEALRLRVQDVDFGMKQLTVRDGKGARTIASRCYLRRSCRRSMSTWSGCGGSIKKTTMIYPHVLRQGGSGSKSPLDCL